MSPETDGTGGGERHEGPSTVAVHAGGPDRVRGGPVVLPLVQSATFFGGAAGDDHELRYTRYGNNPNQLAVARKMAALEDMEASLVLGSGMAATAMSLLSLLPGGGHVVASRNLYGTTRSLLERELPARGIRTTFVDAASASAWTEALEPDTGVLFSEIPANPTMRVFDPRPVAALARERGLVFGVDATFASPVNFRPREQGVDVCIHSATKYLGGHSDLVAGVVSGPAAVIEGVAGKMKLYGPAVDPHAAWLLDRGIRTLALRIARQNENGLRLARWFERRPEVERVAYPGLESHPDHAVAREVLRGYGGMLGVVLRGEGPAADAFCGELRVALQAPSLGGVETLVSQPRWTSHVGLTTAEREALGIPDGFVRISVGVEDPEDLEADFARGLEAAGTYSSAMKG